MVHSSFHQGQTIRNSSVKITKMRTQCYLGIIIIMSRYQHADPLLPPNPIVYCFRQVFRTTSRISTEQLYVSSSWSSSFARPCEGVHRRTSLMSLSLLLQQCSAGLVRLILIVFMMGGRQPYSWCFVGCCLQDVFNIAHSILVQLPSSFFSIRFVSVHEVHPYSSIDTTAAWKKLCFILSVRYPALQSGTSRCRHQPPCQCTPDGIYAL